MPTITRVPLSTMIEPEQDEWLRETAARRQRSIAFLVRKALQRMMDEEA